MDPYVQQLLDAVSRAVAPWLERCVVETSRRLTGGCTDDLRTAAATMAAESAPTVVEQLRELFETDVEQQRTNPLSVLRAAVRHPTEVLARARIPPVRRDEFAERAFPVDVYALSPATWADVDESLREPGLIWGAWKAKSVLDRRRSS
ncbi:MAG: hypothetical protein ABIW84_07860 [Ilumatobacteraceae bacterium]